ncbi:MAG: RagB/SusD family nutrient uptake outer membrane protein [Niabella sp.]
MKRLIYIIVMVSASLMFSCKKDTFLDNTTTDLLTADKVFADSTYTLNFLNDIYAYAGQDIVPLRYSYITSGTGNDYACLEDLTTQSRSYYSEPQASWIKGASTSSNSPFLNYYTRYYKEIRACNLFRKRVVEAPLSEATKSLRSAEARFLRVWYYGQLVRLYGGVPLVGDEPYEITATFEYKRSTLKECIDYIISECDAVTQELPTAASQNATEYGHITSGMALALKARILLMAASPLFNGDPITTDATLQPLLCYSATYDNTLWQKAAEACKALIDLNQYSLNVDNSIPGNGFKMLFLSRKNSEYIFPYMVSPNYLLEYYRFPRSRGGYGFSNPSHNLVACFGMKNGKAITDAASGYDASNPYLNREPRFYASIIYNQANVYLNSTQKMDPVNIYSYYNSSGALVPSADGIQNYYTYTGYYSRKMANDSVYVTTSKNRVYPLIRYAEIILGYAEALNEAGSAPGTDVYTYIKMIRERAGIDAGSDGNYGLATGLTKEEMRTIIQNEYRVELAYEGHWFYDSRRWRTAEVEENKEMQGMRAVLQSSGAYTYEPITVYSSVFSSRMYFMPFPLTEVNMSTTFYQNPGW